MSKIPSNGSVHSLSFFGYGSFKPKKLQKILNNAKAFLFFLTFANIIQGITINGLLKVNVTSIERRFNLLSSESGLIISTYDVAGCLTLLPVSYLGGRGHKPRWIGIGLIVTSVGMMTLALPHFITGSYMYSTAASKALDNENSSACLQGETSINQSIETLCAEHDKEYSSASSESLNNMKYVFMTGQFLIGAGSTPFAALSITFLDDSVDPAQYPIYIGVYYMGALIGPAVGFILGGKLLQIFTEFGVTPDDITTDSPQWVGAWWVGFVLCSITMLFIAIPILGFPKQLRSNLTRKKTVSDFKFVQYTPKQTARSTKTTLASTNSFQVQETVNSYQATSSKIQQETPLMEVQGFDAIVQPSDQALVTNVQESAMTLDDNIVSAVPSIEQTQTTPNDKQESAPQPEASENLTLDENDISAPKIEQQITDNIVSAVPSIEEIQSAPNGKKASGTQTEASKNFTLDENDISAPKIEQQITDAHAEANQQVLLTNDVPNDDAYDDANYDAKPVIFSSNRICTTPSSNAPETYLEIFRIFFKDLVLILTNKAFLFLSLAAAVLGTIVSGFSTFGPKFVESQFSRSASDAANVFGYVFLPASALGLVLGSFLMSGLKLRHKKALLTCFIVSVLGLFAQLIIALSCEDIAFAGISVPYLGESSVAATPPESLESSCNDACTCPFNAFDPICGDNGITYYSPCFAACQSKRADSSHDFLNCSCIATETLSTAANNVNSTRISSNRTGSANIGKCSTTCRWQSLIFASLFFVITTTFMCAIPGADLSLRCFPRALRSLSVGVQWILIRTLGTIPGPIIFGSMIDSTCVLWNKVDPCTRGQGSCVMYRNHELSFSMLILSMIFKGVSVICFGIAWLTYVPAALRPSEMDFAPSSSKANRKISAVQPSVTS